MVTTLEDLPVELFHEVFAYFPLHEIWNMFWNLNLRITVMIKNLPSIPVYLGYHGMSIEVTTFYYEYLSQTNIFTHLTSLCVSDTLSVGNGLWFAQHGSTFINLRHLSLIDIQRCVFEMILGLLSPIDSLIMFSVHFVAADQRAIDTFREVPESVYREQIFRLFPSLCACHLLFGQYLRYTTYTRFFHPFRTILMPIQQNSLNLRSLTLQYCLPRFLSYLFEHLPRLEQFSCDLYDPIWFKKEVSLEHYHQKYISINKHLAPSLRRLKTNWVGKIVDQKSIAILFDCDVLLSLTNFTLTAHITNLNVLLDVLSKLSSQCLYRFDVTWNVMNKVSLSNTSNILSTTLEQPKGPVPIELELELIRNYYFMRAMTLPRMDIFLFVDNYLNKTIVHGRTRFPSNQDLSNNRWFRCNDIRMSNHYDQTNGEFLSLSSNIIYWDRITSISMLQPFHSTYLHILFSHAINLRILTLEYVPVFSSDILLSRDKTLINLVDDESLCNILMSNGLRQLNVITGFCQTNLKHLAHLIVERLPHLKAVDVHSENVEMIEMAPIFVNGLSKLSFVGLCGCLEMYSLYHSEIPLCNSITRSVQMEIKSSNNNNRQKLLIWL